MPSPFPGMDPYLEGYLWPDVHSALAHKIRQQLAPQIQPKYVARLEISITIALPQVRIATVTIRDVAQNILVTSIEILSPVNKREPNLTYYRQKRERLREAHVHLLEVDLLRRGMRPWPHPRLPQVAYLMLLTRAQASAVEVWPITIQEPLPILPVPLRSPDLDAILDLSAALSAIYDEAFYQLSIDYTQAPPPPPLSTEEMSWLRGQLAHHHNAG